MTTEEELKAARKAEKKEKKRQKKLKEKQENITDVNDVVLEKKKKRKTQSVATEKENKKQKSSEATSSEEIESISPKKNSAKGPYQQPDPSDGSFSKAFYTEAESTSQITEEELKQFHISNEMVITGNDCSYRPVLSFKASGFSKQMLSCCNKFEKPTPIQSQCWPILSSGRDIVGIAETGSGKTLAFSLPGLVHIAKQSPINFKNPGPIMLVVAPTRELAMQSSQVITDAGQPLGIQSLCIYGGVPKNAQKKKIRDGVHIIVATPGRLKDLVEEKACHLNRVTYLVLDEADRMLDEGFEKDIRFIISNTHPERQIAMFSATWPDVVQKLANEFLSNAVKVTIGSEDLAAGKNITQHVEVVEDRGRDEKVDGLLRKYHSSRKNRVLVFVLYKKEAARVENMLRRRGWNCIAIHGDKNQYQRIEAVDKFKSGAIPLLIATDVAARGLDIPDVEYVINYSFPLTIEDYVHRIGRTGRGGKTGISYTFFTSYDKPRAGELVNLLRDSKQDIPPALLKFGTHVKKSEHKLYGAFAKDVDMNKKSTKITFDSDNE